MHPSSRYNMNLARSKINDDLGKDLTILDLGGRYIKAGQDRTYYPQFSDICKEYRICDINPGGNVTHVMKGPYELPFEDNSIDLVVSGQTLEHVHNPFRSVAELTRVLKTGHYMIIIAPSSGPTHDNPDCWRFYRDSFKAIALECNLKVIADWIDDGKKWENSPDAQWNKGEERSARWKDHTFVGQKI
jgi:SAM-dependent methyltransferase